MAVERPRCLADHFGEVGQDQEQGGSEKNEPGLTYFRMLEHGCVPFVVIPEHLMHAPVDFTMTRPCVPFLTRAREIPGCNDLLPAVSTLGAL
jgi:hypothetical protein